MHVLLVEDDAVLADGLSRILQGHGMQVEVVGNGLQADQALQRSEVAVAVLDIGLPGIDGFEVVRRLRARGSATPVLLLTARDAVEDRVRGLETGRRRLPGQTLRHAPSWWRASARWRAATRPSRRCWRSAS